ncbi:MAG: cytochrome P450 [Herpetosiphonaceae bacterium]|nr:cytochrome P450 [Herpetosiphonaceae bacterium]
MSRKPTHTPPGQSGLPLIGEIREWLADPLVFAQERAARYGPIWRTHLLGRPCVVLLEPEGNRFMLSSGAQHFSWREGWGRSMLRLMGGGLSLSDGEAHAARRATLKPAFSHATLRDHLPSMVQLVRDHCASWAASGEIIVLERLQTLAFEVAALVVCGPLPPYLAQALHHDFAMFTAGLFTPLALPIPGTTYHRAQAAGKRLRIHLRTLLAYRRANPLPGSNDALSLLLVAADQPDADSIISELLLLLWAGHDTVASLLTWTCYELAQHPASLEVVRVEVAQTIGAADPTPETLRHLPALDRVLRECERLHPPAPGGFRGVVEPFEYHGYHVPRGWLAMYSTVYTHAMPELWQDPARFDPDRFAPPREEGKTAYSLVGFGGGPRICIGLALAQMEMRVIVCELVRRYRWEILPEQDLTRVWLPTNQPKSGLRVTFTAQT